MSGNDKYITQREFDKAIDRIEKSIDTMMNNHLKHLSDDLSNIKLKLILLESLPEDVDDIKKEIGGLKIKWVRLGSILSVITTGIGFFAQKIFDYFMK